MYGEILNRVFELFQLCVNALLSIDIPMLFILGIGIWLIRKAARVLFKLLIIVVCIAFVLMRFHINLDIISIQSAWDWFVQGVETVKCVFFQK